MSHFIKFSLSPKWKKKCQVKSQKNKLKLIKKNWEVNEKIRENSPIYEAQGSNPSPKEAAKCRRVCASVDSVSDSSPSLF